MRIAHLSDLHVLGDEPVSPLRYFNKRITGYVNLRFRRHAVHKREVVRQLARELASHDVDHVVITGDFSNLALEGEMAAAVRLLEQDLGMTADQISVVPGNHDLYTGGSARSRRFARTFAPFIGSDLPDVAVDHPSGPFPYVRLRGAVALIGLSTALPRPPMMASGSVGRAQRRALEAILAHEEVAKRLPVVLMHHPPHNPVSKLRTFTNGLYDAAELREVLSRARNCLVLHGHLHERTHVTWASDRSELHSVGATSASLLHDHDDRMAGFNLYDLGPTGLHAPPRAIVHVPDGPFVERAIPRRDQLAAISYQPSASGR